MPEKADDRRPHEVHRSPQRHRPACRPPHHLGADPGVRDIDEIAPSGRGGEPADVERAPTIGGQPGSDVFGATRARNRTAQVGARAALQESDPRGPGRDASQQAVDDFMGGAVATHGDDQAIAGRRGVVGGIAAPRGLDDLEGHAGTRDRTAAPEAAGSPATGGRVDDYEGARIRLAFSTSRAICCCNAGTVANRFSARSRCTNQTVISFPYRSPSKSSTKTSTVSVFPPNVGRKPTLVAPP